MKDNEAKYFKFLDNLRESGSCNMFGAAVPLRERFGLDKAESREVLQRWMDTFEERHPE